jgi:hypothetical protein
MLIARLLMLGMQEKKNYKQIIAVIIDQHSLDIVKAYPEMRKMQGIAFFVHG